MPSSFLAISAKLLKRTFFFSLFFVTIGVVGNWLFAGIFGSSIWGFDRWSGDVLGILVSVLVLLVFVVVFPGIYLFFLKTIMIGRAIGTLWGEYRDEFMTLVVERAVKSTLAVKAQGDTLLVQADDWFADVPRLMKWVLYYIKQKIPFFEQVEEALGEIDRTQEHNADVVTGQVMGQLEDRMKETKLPMSSGFVWWIVGVNVVIMIAIYLIVSVL